MERRAAMRSTLVFALVVLTFMAANEHTVVVEGSRSPSSFKVQQSPSPSPGSSDCPPQECEASCRAELLGDYIGFQCMPIGDATVWVCFAKDTVISPAPNNVVS